MIEKVKAYRERHRQLGLCIDCPNKADRGFQRCKVHREYMRNRLREIREDESAGKEKRKVGRPVNPLRRENRIARKKERYAFLIQMGLCVRCGMKNYASESGGTLCDKHREEKRRKAHYKQVKKQTDKGLVRYKREGYFSRTKDEVRPITLINSTGIHGYNPGGIVFGQFKMTAKNKAKRRKEFLREIEKYEKAERKAEIAYELKQYRLLQESEKKKEKARKAKEKANKGKIIRPRKKKVVEINPHDLPPFKIAAVLRELRYQMENERPWGNNQSTGKWIPPEPGEGSTVPDELDAAKWLASHEDENS